MALYANRVLGSTPIGALARTRALFTGGRRRRGPAVGRGGEPGIDRGLSGCLAASVLRRCLGTGGSAAHPPRDAKEEMRRVPADAVLADQARRQPSVG
jgi:hypothetical protein